MRMIDADALKKELNNLLYDPGIIVHTYASIIRIIDNQPTIESEEKNNDVQGSG